MSMPVWATYNRIDGHNQNVVCKVLYVIDGDTIKCEINNVKKIVRLANIDAPEKRQRWGKASQNYLRSLLNGRYVLVSYAKKDKYKRLLGEVFLYNQSYSVNYIMVATGNAYAYKKYIKDKAYIQAEEKARKNKLGLWQFDGLLSPEEFRKKYKKYH
ncbi:hypothetical protein A6A11_04980 [Bisgaardia hudsonensis]|nr:hypothetical protein A6A11_04980 [Bisgaardia hudsonensis]